jgi:two-component system phosphate regulon sensor histidine kinase PhoR
MNRRKKLIWQLFPSFLLITLLSLLAVSWYASNSLHHFFLDQTAANLKIRALLVEKQIVAHLKPAGSHSQFGAAALCPQINFQ